MRNSIGIGLILLILGGLVSARVLPAANVADSRTITNSVIGTGGGVASGGRFLIKATAGQVATLTSADAFPYTINPIRSKHDQTLIRGKPAPWAHHDPRPCLMPPDWSGGYSSIFALQQQEDGKQVATGMM